MLVIGLNVVAFQLPAILSEILYNAKDRRPVRPIADEEKLGTYEVCRS